jgi:hypothetical protein
MHTLFHVVIAIVADVGVEIGLVFALTGEQDPGGLGHRVHVELACALMLPGISTMHPQNIAHFPHNRAVLQPLRVHNHQSVTEFVGYFVTLCAAVLVNHFQSGYVFAGARLVGIGGIYDNGVEVHLILFVFERGQAYVAGLLAFGGRDDRGICYLVGVFHSCHHHYFFNFVAQVLNY